MLSVAALLVFAFALLAVAWVFAFTLAPAIPRIHALLANGRDPALMVQPRLVVGHRRRLRSFADVPSVTAPVANWRVAA
jgi:hypothetical protein